MISLKRQSKVADRVRIILQKGMPVRLLMIEALDSRWQERYYIGENPPMKAWPSTRNHTLVLGADCFKMTLGWFVFGASKSRLWSTGWPAW